MTREWSPKSTFNLASFFDFGTSPTARIVPTRMSTYWRTSRAIAAFTGADVIREFYRRSSGRDRDDRATDDAGRYPAHLHFV